MTSRAVPPLVIKVRNLRFRYPGAAHDVLRVPFLDIPRRGMTAIAGPSGSGKSTLIELIAGTLREPYLGSVEVFGTELSTLARDADRQRQLRRIGLITQDFGLLASRTPTQLLDTDLADAGISREERPSRISDALATVDMLPFAERTIAELSGGQRQRVAIARMLARRVECVIADEPTANLDPALSQHTLRLFQALSQRMPVIIITHDPQVAEACDRTIVLQSTVDASGPESRAPSVNRPRARHGLAVFGTVSAVLAAVAWTLVFLTMRHVASAAPRDTPSAAATTARPAASGAEQPPTAAMRRFTVCTDPAASCAGAMQTEPAKISVSTDGSGYLKDLAWSGWGSGTALGTGLLEVDGCRPNCASGAFSGYPATVALTHLERYGGGDHAYAVMKISVPSLSGGSYTFRALMP